MAKRLAELGIVLGGALVVLLASAAGVPHATATEWDYIASGSGRYAGHSTGVLDANGTAVLVFMCSMSAPGAINFEIAVPRPAKAIAQPVTVLVEVGDDRFEIDAARGGEGNVDLAATWGRHSAVIAAARRVFGSTEIIHATLDGDRYEFEGPGESANFAAMLEACGGGR
jgi:hypothetical protein